MLRRGGWIALVGLGLLLGAAPAHAGVYSVYACHGPSGATAAIDGWKGTAFTTNPGEAAVSEDCRSSGAMRLSITPPSFGSSYAAGATWGTGAARDTTIQTVTLDHSFSATGPSNVIWHLMDESGDREVCVLAGGGCAGTAPTVRLASWRGPTVYFELSCRPADTNAICEGPTGSAAVSRVVLELRDALAPLPTAPPTGPLVDGTRAAAGVATATAALSDRGSGVRSLSAEIDGAVAATTDPVDRNGGACALPYTYRVPCKLAATGTVAVDTTKLADGPHQVRLIARDASGNTSAQGPFGITVRNTPVACGPGTNAAITAGLPRKRSASQKRAKAARIRGTAPAGAELRLISRVSRRGDGSKPVGAPVRAGANGRYSLRVPKGPSRSLRVGWRRAGEPDFACSRSLSLKVRARISLSGSPKAIPAGLPRATFRGRLTGGYVPRRGKLVLLQGRQPGRNWRTFRAVRTNRKGRFSTRYRFSGARGLFRVRARVPSEAVYPFGPATSRVVRVLVR